MSCFLQEPDQRVLLGGQRCPRNAETKPDILHNDFIHNASTTATNPRKASLFFCENNPQSEGDFHHFNRYAKDFSNTWRFPNQKTPVPRVHTMLG